jgi:signal transduction histidine kinase
MAGSPVSRTYWNQCTLKIWENDIFNREQAIDVFRIVQEALTNIARHSQATRARIDIKAKRNNLEVVIKDNGIGISESELNSSKSYGLLGMHERVMTLGGVLTIEGIKDKGTTVKLSVPIKGK